MRRVAESRARIRLWRRWHKRVLALKGLDSATALTRGIGSDLMTSIMAVTELRSVGQRSLMEEFFGGEPDLVEAVLDATDASDVAHIGFSIAEPLDIYLEGVPIWADRLGANVVGNQANSRLGALSRIVSVRLSRWLRCGSDIGGGPSSSRSSTSTAVLPSDLMTLPARES